MKKILGLIAAGLLVFGAMGVATAAPDGNCEGDVDLLCTDTQGTEDTSDDKECIVYLAPDCAA